MALPLLGMLGMVLGFIVGLRLAKRLPSLSTSSHGKKLLALILFSAAIPFLTSGVRNPTLIAFLAGGIFVLTALFVLLPVRSLSFEALVAGVVAVVSALGYLETGGLQWLVIAVIWAVATCAVLIRRSRLVA